MSDTPNPPRPPALPKDATNAGAGAQYDRIADKVGLVPNVRKKDNLYQGLCVLAFVIIGAAAAGLFWDGAAIREFLGDSLPIRLVVGALAGLVAGALLSGAVLLVLGLKRKA
jgi:apolipoprotein N-acyltransferase